jgi:DNA polymerase III alpha subunit
MRSNKYGEIILSTDDVFDALYSGKKLDFDNILFDDSEDLKKFNSSIKENFESFPKLNVCQEATKDVEVFDKENQTQWFMPEEYKNFDIETWVAEQCNTNIKMERAQEELVLFRQHNMITLLKYLKYLVDTMREHNIVWGVGRGSSVASYVLYLIGVHKVDSIKYQLDINEFLK